jgi:hypothetical protein
VFFFRSWFIPKKLKKKYPLKLKLVKKVLTFRALKLFIVYAGRAQLCIFTP